MTNEQQIFQNLNWEALAKFAEQNGMLQKAKYATDKNGMVAKTIDNYMICLREEEFAKGKLAVNEYKEQREFNGKQFDEFTESYLLKEMEQILGHIPAERAFSAALDNVLMENKYNPVQDYLNSLQWDGVKRAETLFIDWLGSQDNKLTRAMTKKWLIAAVKRVFEPGCKFDNMIVLKGPQGSGKSTICYRLGKGYYNENIDITNKDYIYSLNSSWIIAFDELATFNKRDMSDIKHFLSQQEDKLRLAYARYASNIKRHCVFIGSTNEENFLRDYTGSVERRFWVIETTTDHSTNKVGLGFTDDIVDQIWAEAVTLYRQDPGQYLDLTLEESNMLSKAQDDFKTSNDDPSLMLLYESIFNKGYILNSKGEFDSYDAFEQQYLGNIPPSKKTSKIDKLPITWVNLIYEKHLKFNHRNANYLLRMFKENNCDEDWAVKVIWYNGKSVRGFYKKA